MARVHLDLPDDLYEEIKEHKIEISELVQQALRAEVRRHQLIAAADEYIAELVEEVGEPSPEDMVEAARILGSILPDAGAQDQAVGVRSGRAVAEVNCRKDDALLDEHIEEPERPASCQGPTAEVE